MRQCNPRLSPERGFTLVELLAVIAILSLLVGLAMPLITKSQEKAAVQACKSNLRQVAMQLKSTVDSRNKGRWPKSAGIQLLLYPVKMKEIEGRLLDIYVCPGTDDTTWPTEEQKGEHGAGFEDPDQLDSLCISYAGRDNINYGMNKNKLGNEVVASDDNDGRANHPNITNIVYGDGAVDQVDLIDYESELEEDAEWVPVGDASPDEHLVKLLID